jgi:hypothetical protein
MSFDPVETLVLPPSSQAVRAKPKAKRPAARGRDILVFRDLITIYLITWV